MNRPRALLVAGGFALAGAVAVPAVAFAQSSTPAPAPTPVATSSTATTGAHCTALDRWNALAAAAPKVQTYLQAHPELVTELGTISAIPKGPARHAAAKAYFSAHQDQKAALKAARAAVREFHASFPRS
ncbi:MAG: hemophore-related protein [Mycobacteriaceae bacterium]